MKLFGIRILRHLFDELPGDRLLWPGEHVEHRAFFDDAAVFHHRYAVADFAHHVHLVGDQHDGQFQLAVDVQQQVENGVGGLRIERRGGLVAQQHARVIGQRAGDADALFLAAAELRRVGVFAPLQADQRDQFRHARRNLRLGHAGDLHGKAMFWLTVRDHSRLKC